MADDYKIGFKRPPKASQFKKGQSGNPRGRPKGARNLKTDLAEELGERIGITVQGTRRRLTQQQALLKSLVTSAIKGNPRSAALVLNMIYRLFESEQNAQQLPDLSPQDEKMLEAFVKEEKAKSTKSKGGKSWPRQNAVTF
jgi:hypothetical protein